MEWIDIKTSLLIGHLFGLAVGAGGAYLSDAMFLLSIKDARFSATELRFLRLASVIIWGGLGLLILTGAGLVSLDWEKYAQSGKFLAKMTIVGIIALNGLVFHYFHLPMINRHVGLPFAAANEFLRRRPLLLASGAISMVSWSSAIVLGAFRSLPWSYSHIMLGYALMIAMAVTFAVMFHTLIIPHKPKLKEKAERGLFPGVSHN